MNTVAWDLLCRRMEEAKGDAAEQMRVLAAINEFVATVMSDLVRIGADGLDEHKEDSE